MRELVYKIEEFYQKHKLVVLLGVLIVLALLPFVFTKKLYSGCILPYAFICNTGGLFECDQWIQWSNLYWTCRIFLYRSLYRGDFGNAPWCTVLGCFSCRRCGNRRYRIQQNIFSGTVSLTTRRPLSIPQRGQAGSV